MDVSIIIVNYNTYKLTCNCIDSILQHTEDITYEIILVDNNSVEEEPIRYEKLFPQIKVIRLKENIGFAKGNNKGIEASKGSYILLLNSDTELIENSVKIAYDYLMEQSDVGVVSARLIFPDGAHQSIAQRFPSIKYQFIELLRLQKFLPKNIVGKLLLGAFFNHKSNIQVDWVWGAFFMFRREILQKLVGNKLDDTFFMYMEDMQWCKDIKSLGYKIHFFAGTEVIHLMGGSSGAKSELMKTNYNIFLKRNYNGLHSAIIKYLNKFLSKLIK